MKYNLFVPVRIIQGENCIANNPDRLIFGKKAYIVTGKYGAKSSGALDDVICVLESNNINYRIFDGSRENPPLELCFNGGADCRAYGADFVIGIGGGSAIDTAKAISAFAANPSITEANDIYNAEKRAVRPLPIVAVPTTSGTGSEANGTSVMTLPNGKQKKSFSLEDCIPKTAFLDSRYTVSLGTKMTISCALDAFAHALESYLSPKSTFFSEQCAIFAARGVWSTISDSRREFSMSDRERLQLSATAAGLAISVTGTGFPHPLGYSLTMLDGIPHGAACAVFDGDFIEYNMKNDIGRTKILSFCEAIQEKPEELIEALPRLSDVELTMNEEEIAARVSLVAGAKNYTNSPYVLSDSEKTEIYRKHFNKGE